MLITYNAIMSNILVVEDHDYLRNYTMRILRENDYTVFGAQSGKEALLVLKKEEIDLILLDLDLGDMNGAEIIKILNRQNYDVPIIVVSNFEQIDTKVAAFDAGCDDYITKPYFKEELLARIRRTCSRTQTKQGREAAKEIVQSGPFEINYKDCSVRKNGKDLRLSQKLFEIFSFMNQNRDQIISKEQLFTRFWGFEEEININTISVHIHMLRSKIEKTPSKPVFLKTKRGAGYIFRC